MLRDELLKAIGDLPAIDVHSHLNRDRLAASDPGAILFYHMLMYGLRSSGLAEDKLWPDGQMHGRGRPYEDFLAYWPSVATTGFGWILRTILRDLYEFDEPLTAESLPRLQAALEARVARPAWPKEVFDRARVVRALTSATGVSPLAPGQYDGGLRFTVEKAPTGGIHEAWTWRDRLQNLSKHLGRDVTDLAGLEEAVVAFYGRLDWTGNHALVAWISSEIDFRPATTATINALVADALAGKELDLQAVRLLEAAYVRAVCRAIRGRTRVFQVCYGVQFLPPRVAAARPVGRAAPEFASSMGHLFGEFQDIHFNILNGYEPDEPIWCAMTQGYANVSLAGFWWETFYPSVMHQAVHRRLDMVPRARLMAFFSDGYCVDWVYGRLRMVQRVLANVMAERIERGFMTREEALAAARDMLFETPRRLFLPDEKIDM
jgi:glucuronate isomerase